MSHLNLQPTRESGEQADGGMMAFPFARRDFKARLN